MSLHLSTSQRKQKGLFWPSGSVIFGVLNIQTLLEEEAGIPPPLCLPTAV